MGLILQIIITVFALFALSRAVLRKTDGKSSISEFIFWAVIWVAVGIFVWLPKVLETFTNMIGVERPIDALIYGSILGILYLIFRLYIKLHEIEQEHTKLVREIAIAKKK